jgi:hypothetical protein
VPGQHSATKVMMRIYVTSLTYLLQAHHNASSHSDEYIVELLVSLDRMHVLVHDLLVIEVRGGCRAAKHIFCPVRPAGSSH